MCSGVGVGTTVELGVGVGVGGGVGVGVEAGVTVAVGSGYSVDSGVVLNDIAVGDMVGVSFGVAVDIGEDIGVGKAIAVTESAGSGVGEASCTFGSSLTITASVGSPSEHDADNDKIQAIAPAITKDLRFMTAEELFRLRAAACTFLQESFQFVRRFYYVPGWFDVSHDAVVCFRR